MELSGFVYGFHWLLKRPMKKVTKDRLSDVIDEQGSRCLDSAVNQPMPVRTPAAGASGRVVAERVVRSRMEVGVERGLTPLVGRQKELALLRDRLTEARTGRGQIVLLAGEPGVGKSRLLVEFQQSPGAG